MMVLCEPKYVGAAFIILIKDFIIRVHQLDNKVFDITDARCNHEVHNYILLIDPEI